MNEGKGLANSDKGLISVKKTFISVSNKNNLEDIVEVLVSFGSEIISTGGTAKYLEEKGFQVTPISHYTKSPEAFNGRMKSLSFELSSSLLYKRGDEEDEMEARKLGIVPIDLVICDFYPFEEYLSQKKTSGLEVMIEKIDIGGPNMVRAAAKNFSGVCICTGSDSYETLVEELTCHNGATTYDLRKEFATMAFGLTASYDQLISQYFLTQSMKKLDCEQDNFSQILWPILNSRKALLKTLRYGENPQQKALLLSNSYLNFGEKKLLATAIPLQGKELSYNNYLDANAAINLCRELQTYRPSGEVIVIVKHNNPCGVAMGEVGKSSQKEIFDKAWKGDSLSAFGSVIAVSGEVKSDLAREIGKKFVEMVIAPKFSAGALDILKAKKNLRLLEVSMDNQRSRNFLWKYNELRMIDGGVLLQEYDQLPHEEILSVSEKKLSLEKIKLAKFGLFIVKALKSNALCLVGEKSDLLFMAGGGMGRPNRIEALQDALKKAYDMGHSKNEIKEYILISDAFFPFRDNIDKAYEEGVRQIIAPGGSMRDEEVIRACNEFGMTFGQIQYRHFNH